MPEPIQKTPAQVIEEVKKLAGSIGPSHERLAAMLQLLAYDRTGRIAQWLRTKYGGRVMHGPFKGMRMPFLPADGCDVPKLLGSYEQELHGLWRGYANKPIHHVINVGCAEGYYAIGLAMLLPTAQVIAIDVDAVARERCARTAEANGVAERITILEDTKALHALAIHGRALAVVDIEGAEQDLLKPDWLPSDCSWDAVVELHGETDTIQSTNNVEWLQQRFAATHDISLILPNEIARSVPAELAPLEEIDRLLALWEWRREATPWANLSARNQTRS